MFKFTQEDVILKIIYVKIIKKIKNSNYLQDGKLKKYIKV